MLQRLAALARLVDLEVASPVPVFPIWSGLRGGLPQPVEQVGGLNVHYPRFFYFPGMFKSLDARLYARGLQGWLSDFAHHKRPDLLDAHFIWPDGVGVYYLASKMGVPYTITLRGKIYECLKSRSMTRQCAEALRNASLVLSVSSDMARIATELGADPGRVHVLLNGVDTQRFAPRDKAVCRRELGLPVDRPLVVAVLHLKPTKGAGELVSAMARLGGDAVAVLVGGETVRGHRRALQRQAQSLGLEGRVILAGPQPYDRVPLYFAAADVSVLASYREGCPNVVLESLASGTPVVATEVGAVPDLIVDGANGRVVPPRDAAALADALRYSLARSWSAQAVRASPAVKSWDHIAGQVLRLFRPIVGRPEDAPVTASPGVRPAPLSKQ